MPRLTSNADVDACTRWLSYYSPTADNQGYMGEPVHCMKHLHGLERKFVVPFRHMTSLPPTNNGLCSKFPYLHC